MTDTQILIAFIALAVWTLVMCLLGVLESRLRDAHEYLDKLGIPKAPPSERQQAFNELNNEFVKLRDILIAELRIEKLVDALARLFNRLPGMKWRHR